jgi:hypothetical protein
MPETLDTDGDGRVTQKEYNAGFGILDSDHDGFVTRKEFGAASQDYFDRLDKDGDGKLSRKEYKAVPRAVPRKKSIALKRQASFAKTQSAAKNLKWSHFYTQAWFWCMVSLMAWLFLGNLWCVCVCVYTYIHVCVYVCVCIIYMIVRERVCVCIICIQENSHMNSRLNRYMLWHEWPFWTAFYYLMQATMSIGFGFPSEEDICTREQDVANGTEAFRFSSAKYYITGKHAFKVCVSRSYRLCVLACAHACVCVYVLAFVCVIHAYFAK